MRPAVKVARIAGASRHSRLETEPKVLSDSDKTCELLIIQEKQCYFLFFLLYHPSSFNEAPMRANKVLASHSPVRLSFHLHACTHPQRIF